MNNEWYKFDKKTADVLFKVIPVKRDIRGKNRSNVDEVLICMRPRKKGETK